MNGFDEERWWQEARDLYEAERMRKESHTELETVMTDAAMDSIYTTDPTAKNVSVDFECLVRSFSFHGDTPDEAYRKYADWLERATWEGNDRQTRELNVNLGQVAFSYSEDLKKYFVNATEAQVYNPED